MKKRKKKKKPPLTHEDKQTIKRIDTHKGILLHFSTVAFTNYHKLSDSKQYKFIILKLCISKI